MCWRPGTVTSHRVKLATGLLTLQKPCGWTAAFGSAVGFCTSGVPADSKGTHMFQQM